MTPLTRVSVRQLSFQSILCPVDFSTNSRLALQHAVAIARRTGGRLTTMYADDPMLAAAAAAGYDKTLLVKASTAEMRRMLVRVGVSIDRDPELSRIECAIGRPAQEIVKMARRVAADLIVLGTQGRSGAGKIFFGSTTEQVLRQAPVPVLAVPPHADAPSAPRWPGGPIVGALDLGPGDRDAAQDMAAIARAFATELMLVHVAAPTWGPPWARSHLRARDRERLVAARARLRKLAASIEGLTADCRVLVGDPAFEVPALAAETHAGLTVLVLRPRHGLFGPRQGSITYRMLCGSAAPVLALVRQSVRTGR